MVFNSLTFALFFIPVYALYLVLPRKWQNVLLLLASYLFYSFWDWRFLSIIWLSTAINFLSGRAIGQIEGDRRRKRALAACIALNLVILGIFKYFNFFADSLQIFLWAVGIHAGRTTLQVILPLGISFYTFQAMTYPIDIYRRVIPPEKRWGDFALFVAFFPNLVAGPIERARNMLPQIARQRRVASGDFAAGAWLIFWGLFKKIVVADNLAAITAIAFDPTGVVAGATALVSMFAFAFQVYADFSGYSDMARGLARLMGFTVMQNFRTPFFASNLYDLWQRWHISLTTWIKEYVYYPLALARFGGRQLAAPAVVILTWAIMGFWHGAEWRFVVWGVYHGVLIVLYNRMRPFLYWVRPRSGIARGAWGALGAATVFTLFSAGLLFFAVDSVKGVGAVLFNIAAGFLRGLPLDGNLVSYVLPFILPIIALESFQFAKDDELAVFRLPAIVQAAAYFAVFYYLVLAGSFNAKAYYYFQF
jgi:D-alanyl-lipoteichoic acid acyltransferase DltB (MBOAT superfamily)